ncbi:hypothetical protein JAAARDRAFT_63386 [Jaapia argillacea MUCL 33604]|uniref:Uncharacterized protein n=1 Tax=Jaapia argillacea MUCL 33604 TaxID=933084 RepID=A0A067PGF4_9AGAM|nr:hypothetical protein JAAARDRAFT_63386 [Jaapia argillacea MUCL 33604]
MIYADNFCKNCDTPTAQKFRGLAGHTHNCHPYPWCKITSLDFSTKRMIFNCSDATERRQTSILDNYGVRWSILNILASWLPATKCALDFMHNIFLGVISHLFMQVLFSGYMFSGAGSANSQKQRFEDLINSILWPSHVTRLPKNMGENQSLKKADEWHCLLHFTPMLLWWSWKDQNDAIPDAKPLLPHNTKHTPTHSRNYKALYSAILLLCNAVRVLALPKISMAQARIGQEFYTLFCCRLISLNVHLITNHHMGMHYVDMIKLFGPVYGWWLFGFERFNGMLEKVNHNGHNGRQMELTLLQNWILNEGRTRGSMMTQLAIH